MIKEVMLRDFLGGLDVPEFLFEDKNAFKKHFTPKIYTFMYKEIMNKTVEYLNKKYTEVFDEFYLNTSKRPDFLFEMKEDGVYVLGGSSANSRIFPLHNEVNHYGVLDSLNKELLQLESQAENWVVKYHQQLQDLKSTFLAIDEEFNTELDLSGLNDSLFFTKPISTTSSTYVEIGGIKGSERPRFVVESHILGIRKSPMTFKQYFDLDIVVNGSLKEENKEMLVKNFERLKSKLDYNADYFYNNLQIKKDSTIRLVFEPIEGGILIPYENWISEKFEIQIGINATKEQINFAKDFQKINEHVRHMDSRLRRILSSLNWEDEISNENELYSLENREISKLISFYSFKKLMSEIQRKILHVIHFENAQNLSEVIEEKSPLDREYFFKLKKVFSIDHDEFYVYVYKGSERKLKQKVFMNEILISNSSFRKKHSK